MTGVDLTPSYVHTATELSRRTGDALDASGFRIERTQERTSDVLPMLTGKPSRLGLANLMGEDFPVMFGHLVSLLREGVLSPVEIQASWSSP